LATLGASVKRETDKDDGLKLPRMAAMNELKAVHLSSPAHRGFRSLAKYYKTLDQRVNRKMNTIRAFFVNHGYEIDRGEKTWNTGRALIDPSASRWLSAQPRNTVSSAPFADRRSLHSQPRFAGASTTQDFIVGTSLTTGITGPEPRSL
jgi:hypothetical protein